MVRAMRAIRTGRVFDERRDVLDAGNLISIWGYGGRVRDVTYDVGFRQILQIQTPSPEA